MPNPLLRALDLPLDGHGRVHVDDKLRVVGRPHVWALGDCAAVPNGATPGETDPATCQHALRQARRLAANLRGTARPYR
jgi:NADH dehydrogenase